jgi:hypothetical protein
MFTLIDIGVSVQRAILVQTEIERCCLETGDVLLGHRDYAETEEALFFVLLMEPLHLSKHLEILDQALQHAVINSFHPAIYGCMMNVSCAPSLLISEQLQGFPLRFGEVWFVDYTEVQQGYLFLRNVQLTEEQARWLVEHEIKWAS